MRLLVTGAGGFVGRGLLAGLSAHGIGGWATGRQPPIDLPPGWRSASRTDVLAGAVDAADVDTVIHLEVKHHVQRPTAEDLEAFHEVNVGGTRSWLDWAARHDVQRFVFLSSIKATAPGNMSEEVPRLDTTLEHGPRRPESPYGRSKASAEGAVHDWVQARDRRSGVILRPAPVYGPGSEANLSAFVRQVIAGRPCLVGSGAVAKSIVSLANLVAAIEFVLGKPVAGCEVFNVSDAETMSLRQLADMIATVAGAARPRAVPRVAADVVARLGDVASLVTGRDFPLTTRRLTEMLAASEFPCTKLEAAGFRHPQSTRQGLEEMVAWLRRQAG